MGKGSVGDKCAIYLDGIVWIEKLFGMFGALEVYGR